MDDKTLYTLLVTVAVAVLGLAGKYWNDLRIAERKDRLERVNCQLRDLYGPLRALGHAGDAAWAQFRSGCRPGVSFFRSDPPPSEEELLAWRTWMREVFIPLHQRMEQVILSNLHLIVGGLVPSCIPTLLAHIAAYRPIIKRWDGGDFEIHFSGLSYPRTYLRDYVDKIYESLTEEQHDLLRSGDFEKRAANQAVGADGFAAAQQQ
jgi:hypothetical protein